MENLNQIKTVLVKKKRTNKWLSEQSFLIPHIRRNGIQPTRRQTLDMQISVLPQGSGGLCLFAS